MAMRASMACFTVPAALIVIMPVQFQHGPFAMTQALQAPGDATLSILVVDDHPLFLEGLVLIIERHFAAACVQAASSLAAAKEFLISAQEPDLILLDLNLPDGSGLQLLPMLNQLGLAIPCILLSASEDSHDIALAQHAGAEGYINKSAGGEHIIHGIDRVLCGHTIWPNTIAPLSIPSLTPRQQQVLDLLAEGLPNKEICRRLSLSNHTIKTHIKALYQNLGVHSRTECIKVGLRLGLIKA